MRNERSWQYFEAGERKLVRIWPGCFPMGKPGVNQNDLRSYYSFRYVSSWTYQNV